MHNLDNVIAAIRRIADPGMGGLGWRQVTVSTVGIVAGIDRLAEADLNVHLAVSLHAPDDETRQGKSSSPRGPYPHIVAAGGREEVLAWAVERSDGGRGFGFTGAHFHRNWGNENFRKIILNALLWTAHAEVPANGVECAVSADDLRNNLDPK